MSPQFISSFFFPVFRFIHRWLINVLCWIVCKMTTWIRYIWCTTLTSHRHTNEKEKNRQNLHSAFYGHICVSKITLTHFLKFHWCVASFFFVAFVNFVLLHFFFSLSFVVFFHLRELRIACTSFMRKHAIPLFMWLMLNKPQINWWMCRNSVYYLSVYWISLIFFCFCLFLLFIYQECRGSFPIVKCTYCRSEFQQTRYVSLSNFQIDILFSIKNKNIFVLKFCQQLPYIHTVNRYFGSKWKLKILLFNSIPNYMSFLNSITLTNNCCFVKKKKIQFTAKVAHRRSAKNASIMWNSMANHQHVNTAT